MHVHATPVLQAKVTSSPHEAVQQACAAALVAIARFLTPTSRRALGLTTFHAAGPPDRHSHKYRRRAPSRLAIGAVSAGGGAPSAAPAAAAAMRVWSPKPVHQSR